MPPAASTTGRPLPAGRRRHGNMALDVPPRMGGWGKCPCCKTGKDLTEHHDKDVGKKFLVCRGCHDVLEEYIRLVADYRASI